MIDPHLRELAETLRKHRFRSTVDYTAATHLDFEADPKRYPYYAQFCAAGGKDPKRNAELRLAMLDRADKDIKYADDLWEMCAQDILFYVNAFVWTYDPRLVKVGQEPNLPFITWPYQDWCFQEAQEAIGRYDLNVEKSRDLGWSWIVLTTMDWMWRFDNRQLSFLLVSAKEDLVDWEDNPDTLFAKLDHIDRTLPWFLQPKKGLERYRLHRKNNDNGSVFNGASSTGDVGRAGRRTAIYMDEFPAFPRGEDVAALAATQKATHSRIWTGTPKGVGTAHAGLRKLKGVRTIQSHWTDHPRHARGLYRGDGLGLDIVDTRFKFPLGYDFKLDKQWRSPYFDEEEQRCPIPWLIQQELNISYLAESRPFFDGPTLDELASRCRPPAFRGELEYDRESLVPRGLTVMLGGKLKLWIPPERPGLSKPFVMGVDVSLGTAGSESSNSVASVWCPVRRMKVAEYVDNAMTPEELAAFCVALARWFGGGFAGSNGAKIIWEQNGPGNIFRKKVVEREYLNLYFRPVREEDLRKRISLLPGFNASIKNKLAAFSEYRRALCSGEAVNLSREAIEEARQYRYMDSTSSGVEWGGVGAGGNKSETGEAHGDICTADVLAWKLVSESEFYHKKADQSASTSEEHCLAARHRTRRADEAALVADYY